MLFSGTKKKRIYLYKKKQDLESLLAVIFNTVVGSEALLKPLKRENVKVPLHLAAHEKVNLAAVLPKCLNGRWVVFGFG